MRAGWLAAWLAVFTCLLVSSTAGGTVLIGPETRWSFFDTGQDPTSGWHRPTFDASSWSVGKGPLGYGEDDVVTQVSNGGNEQSVHTVTYFRTEFQFDTEHDFEKLLLTMRVDDGYAAYLNGREILRWNLPGGPIDRTTFASRRMGGAAETIYRQTVLPARFLTKGKNVFAVQVHQAGQTSSDLFLDARMIGLSVDPDRPIVDSEAIEVTRMYGDKHFVSTDIRIPDGYLDGGRGMQVDEFGSAVSGREIILVDRRIDRRLEEHLAYARSDELQQLSELDRATRIARYVDRVHSPPEGRAGALQRSSYLAQLYRSRQVLLGDMPMLCGAGVCRHRSLLFKVMADEAGLQVALVRGNFGLSPEEIGGHAWNELLLSDGRRVIVDVMNPQPDFHFPEIGERSLRGYLTVANRQKYPPK